MRHVRISRFAFLALLLIAVSFSVRVADHRPADGENRRTAANGNRQACPDKPTPPGNSELSVPVAGEGSPVLKRKQNSDFGMLPAPIFASRTSGENSFVSRDRNVNVLFTPLGI